ncbi:hypothetical protein DFH09DRAFT_77159 [Mycena vulgaris]|nr:hypothetical protein DFH09DRAFT_77159 [Mycena vulgaris]
MLFSGFSLDVVLEIMSWCGPQDLQNLLLVNRLCRNLLVKNQYIWRLSRATIHLGFPLPALATSELSFIRAVFNGGPCTVCHRTTSELPYSFSLDIRICSAACSFYLLRVAPYDVDEFIASDPGAIFVDKPEDLNDSDSETLMLQSLPYLEWSASWPLPPQRRSQRVDRVRGGHRSRRARNYLEPEGIANPCVHGDGGDAPISRLELSIKEERGGAQE